MSELRRLRNKTLAAIGMKGALVGLTMFAAAVAALAVGAGVATAGGGATLSLQVTPSSLIAGGPGFVFATFTNTGNSTLTHVVVNVDLGGATFNAIGSSPACTAAASGASCSLGNVKKGGVVVSTIAFTAPGSGGSLTVQGKAAWDAASVGNPHGAAASKDTATASPVTPNVVDVSGLIGVSGGCVASGGSVTSGDIQLGINGNTSGLPCAPIVAGTTQLHDNCEVLFAKVPNGQTATATLTFPDDCLPWPPNQHGDSPPDGADTAAGLTLFENPVFPNPGSSAIVPACTSNGSIPAPVSGYSTDACVVSVTASDVEDADADAGSIVLNIVGGPGDGSFHGV